MNDFTKEEILQILNFIEHHKQDSYDDMRFKKILIKLQFMIDNYCEHKDKISSLDDNGHIFVQCGRCDYILWHGMSWIYIKDAKKNVGMNYLDLRKNNDNQ